MKSGISGGKRESSDGCPAMGGMQREGKTCNRRRTGLRGGGSERKVMSLVGGRRAHKNGGGGIEGEEMVLEVNRGGTANLSDCGGGGGGGGLER